MLTSLSPHGDAAALRATMKHQQNIIAFDLLEKNKKVTNAIISKKLKNKLRNFCF